MGVKITQIDTGISGSSEEEKERKRSGGVTITQIGTGISGSSQDDLATKKEMIRQVVSETVASRGAIGNRPRTGGGLELPSVGADGTATRTERKRESSEDPTTYMQSAEYWKAKREAEAREARQQEYNNLTARPDFAQNSRFRPYTGDSFYEVVNGVKDAGTNYFNETQQLYDPGNQNLLAGLFASTMARQEAKQMTPDQVAIYNYIYRTEGRDKAQEYYDFILPELNVAERQAEQERWAGYAKEDPVGTSVFSSLMAPARTLSYIGQTADYLKTGKIDENAGYNRFSNIPSDVRQTVSKQIEDSGKWGKVGSFLYQTGMSMGDFVTNLAASGGVDWISLGLMGTGAAADTVISSKQRGLSDRDSFILGTIAGAAEIITEKVSLDRLLNATSLGKSAIGYLLQNILAEGSEEVGSDAINLFADILVAGNRSEWKQSIRDIQKDNPGMSEKQAWMKAFVNQAEKMGLSFLGGALSGAGMAGGGIGLNAALNKGGEVASRISTAGSMTRAQEFSKGNPKIAARADENASESLRRYADIFNRAEASQARQRGADPATLSDAAFISDQEAGDYFYLWEAQGAQAADAYYEQFVAPAVQQRRTQALVAYRDKLAQAPQTLMLPTKQEAVTRQADPLGYAVGKVQRGETLSGNDARAILENPQAVQTLRDAGVLTESIRPGAEGRTQVQTAVAALADQRAQEAATAPPAAQEASAAQERSTTAPAAETAQRAVEGLTEKAANTYTEDKAGLRLPTAETGTQERTAAQSVRAELEEDLRTLETTTQEQGLALLNSMYDRGGLVDELRGAGLLSDEEVQQRSQKAMLRAAFNYVRGETGNVQKQAGRQAQAAEGGQQAAGQDVRSGGPGRSRTGGGSQRTNRVGTGGQSFSQRVEQIRGSWERQEGAGRIRSAVAALGSGERVSTASLGISNGTDRAAVTLLPDQLDAKTEKELASFREAQRSFAQRGVTVKGFTGMLEMEDADGSIFHARGAVSADGKTIWVRMDHPDLTWQQILAHEDFHERVKNDRQLLRDVAAAFDRDFTRAERRAIVNDYFDTYGYYNVSEDYVLEEVLADYYAGIDIYAGTENAQKDIGARSRNVQKTVGSRGEAASEEAVSEANKKYSREVNSITYFSGGGLVDYALRDVIGSSMAVEYDKGAAAVYALNNGDVFVGDVRDFSKNELDKMKDIDYFHASPVCKNYSRMNTRRTYASDSNTDITTAQATADAIRRLMPKVFTLEQVPGYKGSKAYNIIADTLTELGYAWDDTVARASDYGGATSRERLMLRAVRDGALPELPKKVKGYSWFEATADLIDGLNTADRIAPFLQERINATPELQRALANQTEPILILGGSPGGKAWWASANEPSPSITTDMTDSRIIMSDGTIKKPDARFFARIMGLPDSYQFTQYRGKDNQTQGQKVIGNGVPVQLTQKFFGNLLDDALDTGVKFSRETDETPLAIQYQTNGGKPAPADINEGFAGAKFSVEPPYQLRTKAASEFAEGLNEQARSIYDMFLNVRRASQENMAVMIVGSGKKAHPKRVTIADRFLTAADWNNQVENDPEFAQAARSIFSVIPADVRKNAHLNSDGTITESEFEKHFKMARSLVQRLVDALPKGVTDSTVELDGREIRVDRSPVTATVGGEDYRRALVAERRKLYSEGRLPTRSISTLSHDNWGAMGFLATNTKTIASGDFTTFCPQMYFNDGCWYCYRRAALTSGVNNKLTAETVWYAGEILQLRQKDIDRLNKVGGLRIQSFGDWQSQYSTMLADMLIDAEKVGLQIKIITKEPSMIDIVALLREQGLGKNLYFNLSADYTIERRGKVNNTNTTDALPMNPERPFLKKENAEGEEETWWKRALTVQEANEYRKRYPWVNTRIVATNVDEFIRGLKDPTVDVVTGYHGDIRQYERVSSETGEVLMDVEPLGDAGMPVFSHNSKTGEWKIERDENGKLLNGKSRYQKELAQRIQEEGLEREYYTKSCCIFGRCAKCQGKCGSYARSFEVKNATNRDVESVKYWQREMESGVYNPLLESWQDEETNQVRTSRETDDTYLAAVKAGNMDAARRMVDEAAERAGYTVKAWHQTANDFTVFNTNNPRAALNDSETPNGIFFKTNDHDIGLEGKKQMPMVINPGRGLHFKNREEANAWYRKNVERYDEVDKQMESAIKPLNDKMLSIEDRMFKDGTSDEEYDKLDAEWNGLLEQMRVVEDKYRGQLRELLNNYFLGENRPYDSIHLDYDGHRYVDGKRENVETYIVFSNTQAKSADPVTYDDDGNVIPLSERFNPEKQDIRWSRETPGDTEALRAENEELKDRLAYWQSQVKLSDRTQPRDEDVRRVARDLLKTYESKADKDATAAALRELAHTVMSDEVRWTDVRDQATRLAGSILEGAERLGENTELHREIRAAIRSQKLSFSEQGNIPDYNQWRKANFGRLTISKDGVPVETRWQELQDAYGEGYFPSEITSPTDQILYLADLWDRLADAYENPYSADMAEATQYVANEIIDRVLSEEIRQAPTTFADRAEQRVAREALRGDIRVNKVKALLEAERERRRNQVANLKERYKAKEAKGRENRKSRELRTKIIKHARKMTEELLHPTDKRHVPESLRKGVAAVLSAIDLGSGYSIIYDRDGNYKRVERGLELGAEETRRTQAFLAVRAALLKEADGLVMDPTLLGTTEEPGNLTRLVTDLANVPIANMNSEELQVVYDALRGVEAAVRSANQMLSQARWAEVSEAADALRTDNAGKTSPLELNGFPGRVQSLTRLDMLTPEGYFHRLGKAGQAIFKMLRGAQDTFITNMANAAEDTRKIIGDTNTGAMEREQHKVTMGGEEVVMTTAQIMELYCLMQRDQGMQHIMTGGILIEPVRQGVKKTTQTEPLHPSLGGLADAVKLLTADEIRVADALQKYLSVDMAELGNEATLAVYGYKKFGQEDKYWKIRSNRNEIQQSIEKETQTTSVANRGFTKAINPRADTSVKIGSIFDTYSQSINDMATYAAWLAVGEDVNRIRNYVWRDADGQRAGTVKGLLDRVHGTGGANYLQRLLADIANGAGTDDTGLTSGFVGAYKAAAIGANIRVIIQQPTAILRALEMIDPKYMAGLRNPMKAFDRAKKYSPIAQWKDWGYFDINTGRKMKDVLFENPSKLEKVRQVSMALAGKADSFAWGILWGAVEAETKAKTDLTPGTEAFYKACAERFNDIIDHTQVVDGILQRSQIMRSKDTITRMAVSFMSEPTKQYNQFMSAVYDLRHAQSRADQNAAKRQMARTVFSMLAAGLANVLAQSIVDALRDDDREKTYWEKLLQKFFGYDPKDDTFGKRWQTFWRSNMGELINPASYLPYAKDVMSIMQGYSVERMDMEGISDTIKAFTQAFKALNGDGTKTKAYALVKLAEQASKLLGLPAYNVDRDLTALYTTIINSADMPVLQYGLERYKNKPLESGNLSAALREILWDARQKGDGSYDIIVRKMLKDGYSQEIIDKAMLGKLEEESGFIQARQAADAAGNGNRSYDLGETLTAFSGLTLPEPEREELLEANLGETQYAKYTALRDYMEYDTWLSLKLELPDANPTQKEIETVLDSRDDLSEEQKAAFWQIESGAKSTKNNPYGQETGAEAMDALAEAKALTLPTVEDAEPEKVSRMRQTLETAGLSESAVEALAPILGGEGGNTEKWRAVADQRLPQAQQEAALKAVMTDAMYWNWSIASGEGVSLDGYVRGREAYVDLDGSGTDQNGEWTAALETLTLDQDASRDSYLKGVLWQLYTGSTSTKNNPFDKAGGQAVLDAKATGGGGGSGLYAPARIPTLRLPAVARNEDQPVRGLRLPTA